MERVVDIAIIGGGGAGLTAALYTSRAELETVVFEKNIPGGQIAITDLVENFPGFPEGIMGADIGIKLEEQAKKYGATLLYDAVSEIKKNTDGTFAILADGGTYQARVVILAMGANARRLNAPGEQALIGKGVSYCATCDAPFFRGKVVAVIGGGDAAIQEAIFLTKFASHVFVIHRRDQLRAGKILAERAQANEKITIVWNSVLHEIQGSAKVEKIVLKNVKTEEMSEKPVDGVFVFVGHDPASLLVDGFVTLDDKKYVWTDEDLMTSIPGVFACGEIRSGATWQLVAACGEGCRAALNAQHYLAESGL